MLNFTQLITSAKNADTKSSLKCMKDSTHNDKKKKELNKSTTLSSWRSGDLQNNLRLENVFHADTKVSGTSDAANLSGGETSDQTAVNVKRYVRRHFQ